MRQGIETKRAGDCGWEIDGITGGREFRSACLVDQVGRRIK